MPGACPIERSPGTSVKPPECSTKVQQLHRRRAVPSGPVCTRHLRKRPRPTILPRGVSVLGELLVDPDAAREHLRAFADVQPFVRPALGNRAAGADGESAVLAKIAEMPEPDRALGERLHAVIKASAPALSPRLWYGIPAYAKEGKVVCFFQPAQKFKTRYATFGFSDKANLDEGAMWPTSFALTELTAAADARIGALVKKAAS